MAWRAVVWDLGGTLVDTYPALDRALGDVVRAHGYALDDAQVTRLTRRSTGEAISILAERFGIEAAEFEAANAALKRHWVEHPAPAMPGARELLRDLRAAGIANLVVTHRDRASAMSLIGGLGLVVDDLISTADGFARKPDPAMHLAVAQRHRLRPEQCLSVGDRPIDAVAAHRAGMQAVMLETPGAPVDDEADYEVTALIQLRPLLGLA